jgi:hypothetical protein
MEPLRVACPECETTLRVPGTAAGKKVKCPRCGKPVPVPANEEEEDRVTAKPAAKKAVPAKKQSPRPELDEDDEDDEEPNERPKARKGKSRKKKPQKSAAPLIAAAILGVVAIGAVTVGLILLFKNPGDDKRSGQLRTSAPVVPPQFTPPTPRDPGRPITPPPPPTTELVTPPPADPFPGPADLKLTADELGKEEKQNEDATKAKYKGKVIELTGEVTRISKDLDLKPQIFLKVKDQTVNLHVYTTDRRPWERVLPGQSVTLKAGYLEGNRRTSLVGGPIMQVTGTAVPTITAEELAKAYEADPTAADKKYHWQAGGLIVTGEISDAQALGQFGTPEVYLKTSTKLSVLCKPDTESSSHLKVGMKIRVTGVSFGVNNVNGRDVIKLVDCVVMGEVK